MAKAIGLLGDLRGKIGNTVFFVSNGVQVARVYQPVVANPNTVGQITQRAKMALAGRLSRITPTAAIEGLGGDNKRTRRGAFVKNAVRATTYSANGASLAAGDLIVSDGAVSLLNTHHFSRVNGSTYIRVAITTTNPRTYAVEGYTERAVVYLIDPTGSNNDICVTTLLTMPAANASENTAVQVPITPGSSTSYVAYVYVYPMQVKNAVGGVKYSFVGSGEGTYVLVGSERVFGALSFGRSVLITTEEASHNVGKPIETREEM